MFSLRWFLRDRGLPWAVGLTCAVLIVLAFRTWEIVFIPSGSPRLESQLAFSSVVAEREADLLRPVLLIEKWLRLLRASGLEEGDVADSSRFGGLFSQVTAPSQLTSSVSPGRGSGPGTCLLVASGALGSLQEVWWRSLAHPVRHAAVDVTSEGSERW